MQLPIGRVALPCQPGLPAPPVAPAKVGCVVRCRFLDHSETSDNDEGEIEFVVFGRLVKVTRRSLVVECWGYANPDTPPDSNCTRYTILKSCVEELTVFTPQSL